MDTKKIGQQTVRFAAPPSIAGYGNAVGKKEGQGPLASYFDYTGQDDSFSEKSWEKAETAMQKMALNYALEKAGLQPGQLDYIFAGDLLNQCIATSYSLRARDVPFFGLYGACSTMAESMSLGAMLLDGGFGTHIAALTSSHFCSAERQYRNPLEYGGQKPPTAQEANNRGAAMAPAAFSTLRAHFQDTGRSPSFYDLIVTGDLGSLGKEIVLDFFAQDGIKLKNYDDCGVLLFDPQRQDVHAGASGCGCSAVVLTGYLLRQMALGKLENLLFCGTGALHSPTAIQQGESIPGICHAVLIEAQP